ncbi:hypothetical protein GEMRC1_006498 [Eukaryota sp. GEM-RC1]
MADNNVHLALVGQELSSLPDDFLTQHGTHYESVDLSDNCLVSFSELSHFPNIKSLVLDKNSITGCEPFPELPLLQTLWLNDNKIEDLDTLLSNINKSFPQLNYLSLLKNECCPDIFKGAPDAEYKRYRLYVLSRLPHLRFLDSSPISEAERREVVRVGSVVKLTKSSKPVETSARSLDPDLDAHQSSSKCSFGVARYQYTGRHSEGNRYITNSCL